MLSLSDLSGSSSGLKFESYLTGYPIAEKGSYAFARTWYAGEMKRPGCVWTHTLLIPFDALDHIHEFQGLTELFHRPSENWDYTSPLLLSAEELRGLTTVECGVAVSQRLVEDTILSLYSTPEAPTILPAPNFQEYESFVLSLISQQWPRLQRNLTFCTGTFSPRSLNGRSFDLQVVPLNAALKFQREMPEARVIGLQHSALPQSKAAHQWQVLAFADLLVPNSHHLRWFFDVFGVDTPLDRHTFVSLVDSYIDISSTREDIGGVESLIDGVSDRFPSPREASTMKKALFGQEMETFGLIKIPSADLLVALAGCTGFRAYSAADLQLRARAHTIALGDPKSTYEVIFRLVHLPLNSLGEYILNSIFEVLDIDDLLKIVGSRPTLLPMFIDHYPELAVSEKVWQGSLDQQQQLVDVLLKHKDVDWQHVIPAILQARAKGIEYDLVTRLGFTVYDAILNWINKLSYEDRKSTDLVTREWRQLLAQSPEYLIRWLSEVEAPQLYTLAFAIKLLHPRLPVVKQIINANLIDFVLEAKTALQGRERSDVMAFLLSVALDTPDEVAPELTAITFPYVHDAIADETLSHQAWRWFEGQVPILEWWKDWDRCEKLRQCLVNTFIKYNWPLEYFVRALPQEAMFISCVDYCGSFDEGRRFGRLLSKMTKTELGDLPDFVPRVLNEKKRRKQFR